jgi:hypothetical protein
MDDIKTSSIACLRVCTRENVCECVGVCVYVICISDSNFAYFGIFATPNGITALHYKSPFDSSPTLNNLADK